MKNVITIILMCFVLTGCICTKQPTTIKFDVAPELMEKPTPLKHIELKKEVA